MVTINILCEWYETAAHITWHKIQIVHFISPLKSNIKYQIKNKEKSPGKYLNNLCNGCTSVYFLISLFKLIFLKLHLQNQNPCWRLPVTAIILCFFSQKSVNLVSMCPIPQRQATIFATGKINSTNLTWIQLYTQNGEKWWEFEK